MDQAVVRVCFIGIFILNEKDLQTFAIYEKKIFYAHSEEIQRQKGDLVRDKS